MSRYSRQAADEQRWSKRFAAYLRREFSRAAEDYPNGYRPNSDSLERLLMQLPRGIILREAENAYVDFVMPFGEDRRKDVLDILASLFRGGGLISFWRDLTGNYLQARIAEHISHITDTTRRRIMEIVERELDQGQGPEDIARSLRKEGVSGMTINRSRAIARTETVSAMNQGTLLAARSSTLEMEKKWDATIDARTRLVHRDADRFGDWVDIDQDFWLAGPQGSLEPADAPGDNRLSASNVVNCRCGVLLRPKRDANGRLIRK